MHLRLLTSLLLLGFICIQHFANGQDSLKYIHSPYRSEPTPYFKLNVFQRGFSNDLLKKSLDSLETKPRTAWSRYDSLKFAQISLRTGNRALSGYYFDHLKVDVNTESDFWFDELIIFYMDGDYKGGYNKITSESPMILEYSEMYFVKHIFRARVEQLKNDKWYKKNAVFNWEIDTTLNSLEKDGEVFQREVIQPLRNLEKVLQRFVAYVHSNDVIIGTAFREMGHVIEEHLSLSQAYIAYSLGRHYNKKDKRLLEDIKSVKGQLTKKKFKIPNFRKYFPRKEEWRFDYKVLKEKVIYAKNDTNVYVKPQTMIPKEKPLFTFPHQYIVLGGLLLLIVLMATILKVKK